MRRLHALLFVGLLFTVACGDDAPTAPSNASVAGNWNGTAQTPLGPSAVRLSITQDDDEVRGTWAWDGVIGGNLGGYVSGQQVSVNLRSPIPSDQCRIDITASVNSTRMNGTYAGVNCPSTGGGAVELTKQ